MEKITCTIGDDFDRGVYVVIEFDGERFTVDGYDDEEGTLDDVPVDFDLDGDPAIVAARCVEAAQEWCLERAVKYERATGRRFIAAVEAATKGKVRE